MFQRISLQEYYDNECYFFVNSKHVWLWFNLFGNIFQNYNVSTLLLMPFLCFMQHLCLIGLWYLCLIWWHFFSFSTLLVERVRSLLLSLFNSRCCIMGWGTFDVSFYHFGFCNKAFTIGRWPFSSVWCVS